LFRKVLLFRDAKHLGGKIALIVTVYKRLYNIHVLFDSIRNQTLKDFDVFIVNNNSSKEAISDLNTNLTRLERRQVFHLEVNHGAYIRYFLAKKLSELGYAFGVFIDDDEELKPTSMEMFLKDATVKGIRSIRNLHVEEGGRMSMARPDYPCNVCNAGGMVIDLSLFAMASFWNEWETCYRSQDDLWISYFAKKNGWSLGKATAEVILDSRNGDADSMYKKPGQNVVERAFLAQYYNGQPIDVERIVKSKMGLKKPVDYKNHVTILNAPWRS
jgi:glycosyltransferase involved in cell wall biosynthesis